MNINKEKYQKYLEAINKYVNGEPGKLQYKQPYQSFWVNWEYTHKLPGYYNDLEYRFLQTITCRYRLFWYLDPKTEMPTLGIDMHNKPSTIDTKFLKWEGKEQVVYYEH